MDGPMNPRLQSIRALQPTETSWSSYAEGPRWAGLKTAIYDIAITCGLAAEINEDKGLIRTTVYFTVRGPQEAIRRFRALLAHAINDYNAA
jgi:hypothetical protein